MEIKGFNDHDVIYYEAMGHTYYEINPDLYYKLLPGDIIIDERFQSPESQLLVEQQLLPSYYTPSYDEKVLVRATRQAQRPTSTTSTSVSIPLSSIRVSTSLTSQSVWDALAVPIKMSLVDFYTVMQDQPTASAHSRVISMTCYKSRRGVRHEYLILQVHSPQLTSRWIRLERAAQADMIKSTGLRNRFTSSSSTFVPDDTAIIAASPDLSFEDAKVMEHIIFSSVQQPSLWTLSKLLEAFCKESMVYTNRHV